MNGQVCILGEVLFDCFPDGSRVLGGAPFNVAWHLTAFGIETCLVSRVGDDDEGRAIRQAMRDWQMDDRFLQNDPALPTGRVTITLDDGEPEYDIVHPVAYDRIDAAMLPDVNGLLYHGSLAVRDERSRQALTALRHAHRGPVFLDVNLRDPWWQADDVIRDVAEADWVKLNADEMATLSAGESPETFLERYGLSGLILTRGAHGAELHRPAREPLSVTPSPAEHFVDAVGAGDAFAAVVIAGLVGRWPLDETLRRAQDFASAIVGNRGATVNDRTFYKRVMARWQ